MQLSHRSLTSRWPSRGRRIVLKNWWRGLTRAQRKEVCYVRDQEITWQYMSHKIVTVTMADCQGKLTLIEPAIKRYGLLNVHGAIENKTDTEFVHVLHLKDSYYDDIDLLILKFTPQTTYELNDYLHNFRAEEKLPGSSDALSDSNSDKYWRHLSRMFYTSLTKTLIHLAEINFVPGAASLPSALSMATDSALGKSPKKKKKKFRFKDILIQDEPEDKPGNRLENESENEIVNVEVKVVNTFLHVYETPARTARSLSI